MERYCDCRQCRSQQPSNEVQPEVSFWCAQQPPQMEKLAKGGRESCSPRNETKCDRENYWNNSERIFAKRKNMDEVSSCDQVDCERTLKSVEVLKRLQVNLESNSNESGSCDSSKSVPIVHTELPDLPKHLQSTHSATKSCSSNLISSSILLILHTIFLCSSLPQRFVSRVFLPMLSSFEPSRLPARGPMSSLLSCLVRGSSWSSVSLQRSSLLLPLLIVLLCGTSCCDANRNSPPRFVVEGGNEIVVNRKEGPNTPVGSVITELRGTDPDGDDLTFGLQGQEANDLLAVEKTGPDTAVVTLKRLLDREKRGEFTLVLTLTDGKLGDNSFITQSMLLLVEDVNDNEPIFMPYESTIRVEENSPPKVLASLRAMDSDEGPYGQVVYALAGDAGDDEVFSVSTRGGEAVLELTGLLDYEQKNIYQLKVLARDRAPGTNINTGTAAIVVQVQDVEDQPPEFTHAPPVTRIPEDIPVNSGVLQVRAVDGDKGVNNKITYRILDGDEGFFGLDPETGVLYVAQPLDRERQGATADTFFIKILAEEVSSVVSPPPSSTTEVTVLLQDVNDQTPHFRSSHYIAEVTEAAQFNMPVNFIGDAVPVVYDNDQGINGTFRLEVVGPGEELFDVTPREGINLASFLIRVKDPSLIDYERVQVVNFTIVARETVPNNPKSSSSLVSVFIRDTNDNVPVFEDERYQSRIREDAPGGSVLARVRAHDPDSGDLGSAGLRYTELRGAFANRLTLDPLTGDVLLKSNHSLDREEVNEMFVTVEVRDDLGRGNRNTVSVHIIIEDVNDNAPQFTQKSYQVVVEENAKTFEVPIVLHARDNDLNGTANHEVRYTIVGGDPLKNFTINEVSGELRPSQPLDYEKLSLQKDNAFFNLTVTAYDLGEPSLSSMAQVLVYVSDVNDHQPEFERMLYRQSIPEDTPGGTTVLQVLATDDDGSETFNTVVYRIQSGADDKFVIDAQTGAILVARGAILDPDRTQPRTTAYPLEVIALDGGIGEQQKRARTLVNITIVDVNNKPPMFVDPGTVRVRESLPPGNFIARIEATDADEDHELKYSLDYSQSEGRSEQGAVVKASEYNYTSAFEIGEDDGVIRLVKSLDREKVETIRIIVVCEDLKTIQGPSSATSTLTILVEDSNDNDPKFRKSFYRRTITENAEHGMTVLTVVADDVDKNRTITYSIQGQPNITSLVQLDPDTGEILVNGRIDRETHSWLNFTVTATDSGVPLRSQTAEVYVQVLDENDNNPEFVNPPDSVTVKEDAPPGTVVLRLRATDADRGDYGLITYLLDHKSSQGMFLIDPETGELTVGSPLDREKVGRLTLIAQAWDNYKYGHSAGESRHAFIQIDVEIADVNDEAPVFEEQRGCSLITEFHEPGDTVHVIRATDADDRKSPNGRIHFSIVEGNEQGLFAINDVDITSARVVAVQPLVGLYGNYSLTVAAQDQGEPQNEARTSVDICVADYNDHPPRFVSPDANVTIRVPENATVGSLVIQVRAVDDDIGANGAVTYRLKKDTLGTHKTFNVDALTGAITLLQPLDRERQKIYQIRVEAFDQGVPTPLSSDLDLTIYVRNINDYQPQFQQDVFHVNFTEHSPPMREGIKLLDTVDHDDTDLEEAASLVCYYIVGGDTLDTFNLDKNTHILTATRELDREERDQHILLVKANEDCLSPPQQVTAFDSSDDTLLKVVVNVNDINDNAPKFLREIFTGGISTESDFGMEVMKLVAIDPDFGRNSELTYSIEGKVQATISEGLDKLRKSPFIVDPVTGAIKLNFDPQRGMKGYFDFEVFVNDTDGLNDRARVFIYLLRDDQRVRFILRQSPDEVRSRIEYLRDYLSNVTGAIVNVDDYRVHENNDGTVDQTKTDLYLHLVNKEDHSVLEVPQVLSSIDANVHQLDHLFKEMNVLDTSRAQLVGVAGLSSGEDNLLMVWLVGVVAFLALLLVVTLSLCVAQRAHYARQLKAATATAFGSNESGLNRVQTVPNTNLHSVEGSNPIWMSGFDNEWYKEEESLSQTSEAHDSLDENAVDSSLSPRTERDVPYIRHSGLPAAPSSREGSTVASNARLTTHEQTTPREQQNGASRSHNNDTYRNNLQHTFKNMTNPLLDKKLETTEL